MSTLNSMNPSLALMSSESLSQPPSPSTSSAPSTDSSEKTPPQKWSDSPTEPTTQCVSPSEESTSSNSDESLVLRRRLLATIAFNLICPNCESLISKRAWNVSSMTLC